MAQFIYVPGNERIVFQAFLNGMKIFIRNFWELFRF